MSGGGQTVPHNSPCRRAHRNARRIREHLPPGAHEVAGPHRRALDAARRDSHDARGRHHGPAERGEHVVERVPPQPLPRPREENVARERQRFDSAERMVPPRMLPQTTRRPVDDDCTGTVDACRRGDCPLSSSAITAGSCIREPGSTAPGEQLGVFRLESAAGRKLDDAPTHPPRRLGLFSPEAVRGRGGDEKEERGSAACRVLPPHEGRWRNWHTPVHSKSRLASS